MRTAKQLQSALGRITNLSEFARIHKLPLRTLCRLRVDVRAERDARGPERGIAHPLVHERASHLLHAAALWRLCTRILICQTFGSTNGVSVLETLR